jgi:hypothetical protein
MGRALLAAILLVAWTEPADALTIAVPGGTGRSHARDGSVPAEQTVLQPFASPPFSSGPVSAVAGASFATTTYTFTNSALSIEFSLARTGGAPVGIALSDDFGTFNFVLDQPAYATVSGGMDVTDTGLGDFVWFQALLELGIAPLHFTSVRSRTTPNESFVVGQGGGDDLNEIVGPTTVLLAPNVAYEIEWLAWMVNDRVDAGDTGATATGYVRIDFVEIPEPSTFFMLGAGLAALGIARGRV